MKVTKINKAGLDIIKHYESLQLKAYVCPAGVNSIGYGTTRYPNGSKVTLQDRPITEAEAESFLQYDLKNFESNVDAFCTDALTENQFSALVSFCYNVGPANLKSSTLLKKVNANPSDPSIRQEFMRWIYGKGKKLEGLERRRTSEADLYFKK